MKHAPFIPGTIRVSFLANSRSPGVRLLLRNAIASLQNSLKTFQERIEELYAIKAPSTHQALEIHALEYQWEQCLEQIEELKELWENEWEKRGSC